MADHRNQTSPSRNRNLDPTYDVQDEDPLVELARIVSEEGGYLNISEDQSPETEAKARARDANPQPDPGFAPTVEDTDLSLENQLLEELEISMAPTAFEMENVERSYQDERRAFDRELELGAQDIAPEEIAPEEIAPEEIAPEEIATGGNCH